MGGERLELRLDGEREHAGEALVQDGAERVDIGACVHRFGPDLLRRDIGERADPLTSPGQPVQRPCFLESDRSP